MPPVIVLNDLHHQTDIVNPLFLMIFILATDFFSHKSCIVFKSQLSCLLSKILKKIWLINSYYNQKKSVHLWQTENTLINLWKTNYSSAALWLFVFVHVIKKSKNLQIQLTRKKTTKLLFNIIFLKAVNIVIITTSFLSNLAC